VVLPLLLLGAHAWVGVVGRRGRRCRADLSFFYLPLFLIYLNREPALHI
jgi:hypothetical protein